MIHDAPSLSNLNRSSRMGLCYTFRPKTSDTSRAHRGRSARAYIVRPDPFPYCSLLPLAP